MKLYMNISFFYEGGLFGVDSIINPKKSQPISGQDRHRAKSKKNRNG